MLRAIAETIVMVIGTELLEIIAIVFNCFLVTDLLKLMYITTIRGI
jgi:hypothetical protein